MVVFFLPVLALLVVIMAVGLALWLLALSIRLVVACVMVASLAFILIDQCLMALVGGVVKSNEYVAWVTLALLMVASAWCMHVAMEVK